MGGKMFIRCGSTNVQQMLINIWRPGRSCQAGVTHIYMVNRLCVSAIGWCCRSDRSIRTAHTLCHWAGLRAPGESLFAIYPTPHPSSVRPSYDEMDPRGWGRSLTRPGFGKVSSCPRGWGLTSVAAVPPPSLTVSPGVTPPPPGSSVSHTYMDDYRR